MVTDLTTPSTPVGFQESLLCLRFLSLFNSDFVWTKWVWWRSALGFVSQGLLDFLSPFPVFFPPDWEDKTSLPMMTSCCCTSEPDFSRPSTRIIDSWIAPFHLMHSVFTFRPPKCRHHNALWTLLIQYLMNKILMHSFINPCATSFVMFCGIHKLSCRGRNLGTNYRR